MDSKQRAEVFIVVKQKLEEIMELIHQTSPEGEYLASYCFGLPVQEDGENTYEFFAGYTAETPEEIDAMLGTVINFYEANQEDDDDTSDIDYWLNLN